MGPIVPWHLSMITERGPYSGLQPPLRPNTTNHMPSGDDELEDLYLITATMGHRTRRHNKNAQNAASSSNDYSGRHAHPGASDLDVSVKEGLLDEDPFADQFGDSRGV